MANANVRTEEKYILTEVETTANEVTLVLSENEAKFLRAIFQKIGGNTTKTPRKFANSIEAALSAAGIVKPKYAQPTHKCGATVATYLDGIHYSESYEFDPNELT